MSKPKHSPEPWRYVEMQESGKSHPTPMLAEGPYAILLANTPLGESYARAAANTQRAGQCVNACAGIESPAAALAAAREALKQAAEVLEIAGRNERSTTVFGGNAAASAGYARHALALLTPKP